MSESLQTQLIIAFDDLEGLVAVLRGYDAQNVEFISVDTLNLYINAKSLIAKAKRIRCCPSSELIAQKREDGGEYYAVDTIQHILLALLP